MGEVIRVSFQQAHEQPKTFGNLALAEPPHFEPRKRHLSVVRDISAEAATLSASVQEIPDNVVDLTQRRQKKQAALVTLPTVLHKPLYESPQSKFIPATIPEVQMTAAVDSSKPRLPLETLVFHAPAERKETAGKTDREQAQEHFYTKEWVQQEVERVKKQPLKAGEKPWWHLSGTGFWVKAQIGQLVRNLQGVGKEAFPDVLELELSKVAQDFEHFEREYLQQMASLTWNLSWQNRDGQRRIICPDYKGGGKDKDGALWSSVTSKDEREGVVYKTLFGSEEQEKTGTGGVEGWVKTAKPGSFAFIISPEGWSGFDKVTYPETQCYGIQVMADGSLKAHTFRYDATVAQNEALQKRMDLKIPEAKNAKERIKNTLANVALLTPEDAARVNIQSLEDFVDLMQESVGGRQVAYGKGGGVKTFDEIRAFVKSPEQFLKKHEMTEKLSNRFKEYARWRFTQGGTWQDIEQDLQIAKAFNPLQLNQAYTMEADMRALPVAGGSSAGAVSEQRRLTTSQRIEQDLIMYARSSGGIDYNQEKKELEKRPGCAGGGASKTTDSRYANTRYSTSMGGSRAAELRGSIKPNEDEYGSLDFECTQGHRNTRPSGQLIPNCTTCGESVAC